jgi:hypothetical protein
MGTNKKFVPLYNEAVEAPVVEPIVEEVTAEVQAEAPVEVREEVSEVPAMQDEPAITVEEVKEGEENANS